MCYFFIKLTITLLIQVQVRNPYFLFPETHIPTPRKLKPYLRIYSNIETI